MESISSALGVDQLLLFQSSRCAEAGDYEGALRGFSSLLSFHNLPTPLRFAALAARGEVHYHLEHFKRAIDDFSEAEKLKSGPFPEQQRLRFQRGMALGALSLEGSRKTGAAGAKIDYYSRALEDLDFAIADSAVPTSTTFGFPGSNLPLSSSTIPLTRREVCLAHGMRGIVLQSLNLPSVQAKPSVEVIQKAAMDLDRIIIEGPYLLRENIEAGASALPGVPSAAPSSGMEAVTAAFTGIGFGPSPMGSTGDASEAARQILREISAEGSAAGPGVGLAAAAAGPDVKTFYHPLHLAALLARSRVCFGLADFEGVTETVKRYIAEAKAVEDANEETGKTMMEDLKGWTKELSDAEPAANEQHAFRKLVEAISQITASI
ncbi:hypothetical protein HDU93_002166 [Gonapodya sp. JEL0774]|nr:hypothetical protein HDU93_002166 [Gonapodya sp. JEL0774]